MRRLMLVLVMTVALAATACSSGSSGAETTSTTTSTTVAAGDAPLGGAKTPAEQKAAATNDENTAVAARCATDLQTIKTAVEAYTAVNGAAPASVAGLAPDFLKQVPDEWQLGPVGADGSPTVVPTQVGVAAGCRADGTPGG